MKKIKMNTFKVFTSTTIALILILNIFAASFAAVTPTSISLDLLAGQSATKSLTVDVPSMPAKADVVFAFDLTSSMGSVLSTSKNKAVEIMNNLNALGVDINYGVVSYMDYPSSYSSYGYNAIYGSAGVDYPYLMNKSLSSDVTNTSNAINALTMGSGYDFPESYSRLFYESYSDSTIGWRPEAKRIVVNFADAIPHDNDINEGVPGMSGIKSTGGDPGRDGIMFTADDIDLQAALTGMQSNHVVLLACQTDGSNSNYWSYWASLTGGKCYNTNAGDLSTSVVSAVQETLVTPNIENLHLEASSGYEAWLSTVSPSSYTGVTNVAVDFSTTLSVPVGTTPGTYTFKLNAIDKNAVGFGTCDVTINVKSPVSKATVDIKPDTLNLKSMSKENAVTAYLTLTNLEELNAVDLNTVNITVYGKTIPALLSPSTIGDYNADGVSDLMIKFDRSALIAAIDGKNGDTEIFVKGSLLSGKSFESSDVIKVIK